MSYGGSSNTPCPPWQRNTLGNAGQPNQCLQTPQMMNTANFVGFQGLTMSNAAAQNANLTLIPNLNTMNNPNALFANHQSVQYQNRPTLNPNAFQAPQQTLHHPAAAVAAQNQASSMQAVQNSAAFKWNTNLVQQVTTSNQTMSMRSNVNQSQLPMQSTQQQQNVRNFSGYGSSQASQSQSNYGSNFERASNSVRNPNNSSSSRQSPPPRSRSSPDRSSRGERSRDDEETRKRRKEREREREKEQEKRDDRSPIRRISPRRRTRPIPRYLVQMPKTTLNATEADIMELRRRYNNLYVPPYFFYSRIRWSESFPCHSPFSIKKPSTFHIFHKSVENPNGLDNGAVFDPPDANDSFSAKVMLIELPPITEFYRKCFASADEKERDDLVHPSRLISFLIGVIGKNEPMAIGGAWSPSLDGPNPDKDPSVLIKTAIRTCKALTGIDLSPCTQWYRFVELYYKRVESVRNGRVHPARTQTVVIFLPDVRSCLPTRFEWDELSLTYKKHLEMKFRTDNTKSEDRELAIDRVQKKSHPTSIAQDESATTCNDGVGDGNGDGNIKMADGSNNKLEKSAIIDGVNQQKDGGDSSDAMKATDGQSSGTQASAISKDKKSDDGDGKIGLIHFSELDVKTMKIQELRDQLDARGLSTKGLKPQLVARLSKALKTEESESNTVVENQNESNADASGEVKTTSGDGVTSVGGGSNCSNDMHESASNDSIDIDMADIVVIDEYDSTKNDSKNESSSKRDSSKKLDEREQRYLEKRYRLPDNPHILCHPLQHSSFDKFTCEVRSLSLLLDYRPENTKKHCFEVSLFAELFNEMLIRDFGFNIYKVLHALPETESTTSSEHDSKDRRDKSADDEPKEKRHRRDSKSSKRDEISSSSTSCHDKSKSDADREKDSKNITNSSSSSSSGKDFKSRDKDREKEKEKEKDKDKERRERRISRREEEKSDDERSTDGKKRETRKMVTIDPDLLLSFIYFDQTYCGYIFSNHLEELFYALGLRLSRADTKKIINKVAPRSLFYRKLTDKPKDEAPTTIPSESIENVEELGKGNNLILPVFVSGEAISSSAKVVVEQPTVAIEIPKIESIGENSTESTGENRHHTMMYNGALIDVEKLLQQLNRSERAREETEWRLSELNKTYAELQTSNSKAKDKIKDLQSELKSCNRKMNDAESSLSSANKKCTEYYSVLCGIHDKVSPIVAKSERSSSKKSESSNRDKDRRDREKEKNNVAAASKEKESKEKIDIKTEIKSEKHEKATEKSEKSDKSEKPDEN